jgi:hypothetical protein
LADNNRLKNRNNVIIILVAIFLIVVVDFLIGVGIGIKGYFFFSSPNGQALINKWIRDPVGLTATATAITAIATIGAAIGTIGAVIIAVNASRYERKEAQDDREVGQIRFQVSNAQTQQALEEGRKQFEETQHAAHRPILMPYNWEPHGFVNPPMKINWNDAEQIITIKNAGTGIATNVWGVLLPPESLPIISSQYSTRLRSPLVNDDEAKKHFTKGGTMFNCGDKIGIHTLCLPKERAAEENLNSLDRSDRCIARLTLTCSDVYGKKHATIFDYTITGDWVGVAFIHDITYDLGEIDEAKRIEQSNDVNKASHPDLT